MIGPELPRDGSARIPVIGEANPEDEHSSPSATNAQPSDPSGESLVTPGAMRPMASGAVMSALSRGLVTLASAATTILVAHVLGPSGFGAYVVAQTLLIVLMVVATLGVDHGILYYVSSGRWSPTSAFRGSQRLALVCGVTGAGGGVLARILVPQAFHGLSLAIAVAAAATLPFALSWFYGSYVALGTGHYEGYVLPPALQSLLALCLVSGLAIVDGVPGAVLGFVLAHVITALVRYGASRRSFAPPPGATETNRGQLRRAVGFGIKGYAANSLQMINYRLDLFILNATAAGVAVGHYGLAVSVTSVMWLLPQALSDVLFPRVAALSGRSGEHSEMLRLAEAKSLRHCVLITLFVAIVCALALVFLVVPIYGAAFRPSVVLGFILLPGAAVLAIANPLSAAIVARGHPGLILRGALVVTPLTVAAYVLLIPSLHAVGAALASSASYTATFVLAAIFYRRVTGRNPLLLMLPTRSEFADFQGLANLARQRVAILGNRLGKGRGKYG
jgi:O-antigen/teichoic acid export membrane protein